MGILIPNTLTKDQYVKVFSNPVSGIACEVSLYIRDHGVSYNIQNIRYSKSMISFALYFWNKQMTNYFNKIRTVYNPLRTGVITILQNQIREIVDIREKISKLPYSFLFSHRYIKDIAVNPKLGFKYSTAMNNQSLLINRKYPSLLDNCESYGFQENSMDMYYRFNIKDLGIEFTVFPNEHPYIQKQKISKVGMTDQGNLYILHKKRCVNK